MPTLWKHPESQYWFAKITLPDGRRTSRSTKQTDKAAARETARTMEKVAALARKNELTQGAVVKLAQDLAGQIGAPAIHRKTVEGHCRGYLAAGKWSGSTLKRYRPVVAGFLEHLGTRAKASLASLTSREVEAFRDHELTLGKGKTTADFAVKVLRGILRGPLVHGEIQSNPAAAVELFNEGKQERQPFTPDELRDLLKKARGTDWEGMILFGGHVGIRLADCAHLTWGAVDLAAKTVEFVPTKTGAKVKVALHPEAVAWLKRQPRGIGKAPLFPTLCRHKTGSAGGLSNQFSALMARANIAVPRGKERTGKGRTFRAKGFHSLRHTMISRMANADVSQDVRRAIAGHASDAAHERYVHLQVETQRRAVVKMPKLGS